MIAVRFDGVNRPNLPAGQGGIGFVVKTYRLGQATETFCVGRSLKRDGSMSNNKAEYSALLCALLYLKEKGLTNEMVRVEGDSKLVVETMSGRWKVKSGLYMATALRVREVARAFNHIKYKWIKRKDNWKADLLCCMAVEP